MQHACSDLFEEKKRIYLFALYVYEIESKESSSLYLIKLVILTREESIDFCLLVGSQHNNFILDLFRCHALR